MTIVNFRLGEREVCILSDTLLCDQATGLPCDMRVKPFGVQEMTGVMVGLGLWSFIEDWASGIQGFSALPSVRALDKVAQARLARVFAHHVSIDDAKALQSRIYHFGYDNLRKGFIGYRYRSEGGFRPKRLRPGIVCHPWIDFDLERSVDAVFPDDFIAYAHRQKAYMEEQGERPVGGQLVAHRFMIEDEVGGKTVVATQWVCHTYPEFEPLCTKLGLKPPLVDEVTVRWPVGVPVARAQK